MLVLSGIFYACIDRSIILYIYIHTRLPPPFLSVLFLKSLPTRFLAIYKEIDIIIRININIYIRCTDIVARINKKNKYVSDFACEHIMYNKRYIYMK